MSIAILKTPGHENTRTFVLEGIPVLFPPPSRNFTDKDDALKSGFLIVGTLLATRRVHSVQTLRSDMIPGYTRGIWDALTITLNPGFSWDGIVKGTTLTVADKYAQILDEEYIRKGNLVFQAPNAPGNQTAIVARIENYLKGQMASAVSTAAELTEKRNRTGKTTIYDKIKIDNGAIRVESYNNGVLRSIFSGKCGSDCIDNDTSATESVIAADLRQHFPFVQQYIFIKE